MPTPPKAPPPVAAPFQGLMLDRPPWQVPLQGFTDCNNVRLQNGTITSDLLGWDTWKALQLNGPALIIDTFVSGGSYYLVFASDIDLYSWNPIDGLFFITPTAGTSGGRGTVSITHNSTTVTSSNVLSGNIVGNRPLVRQGDEIAFTDDERSPTADWYEIANFAGSTAITLATPFTGATNAVSNFTIRQKYSSTQNWSYETYANSAEVSPIASGDIWIATNGVDPITVWKGGTASANFANMPFVAAQVRRFKNMMIYGGLYVYADNAYLPADISNSDNGFPLTVNTGIAGQFTVSDAPFLINSLSVLGNNLLIGVGNPLGGSMVAAQFVGSPTLFVFTEIIKGRGPLGAGMIAEFPDRVLFLSTDGEYRFNGSFIQRTNKQIWPQSVLLDLDISRLNTAFTAINQQYGDLIWAVPLVGDAGNLITRAYVEHYMEMEGNPVFKPYTKRDFPFTCSGFYPQFTSTTFSQLPRRFNYYLVPFSSFNTSDNVAYPLQLAGDNAGFIYSLYTADSPNASFVTFGQRPTGSGHDRGLIKRVYPFANYGGAYNLTVTVKLFDQIGGNTMITDTKTMNLQYSSVNPFTDHYRRGLFYQVTFSTAGPSQSWTITGYDTDCVGGGKRLRGAAG